MQKMSVQDKKTIEKYKKKVHSKYPGAFLTAVGNGYFTILVENEDLTATDILAELFFNPVKDANKAWELAQTGVKVNQNLDRTHPLRIDGMNLEDKIARVESRRLKSEIRKEMRNSMKTDIYY